MNILELSPTSNEATSQVNELVSEPSVYTAKKVNDLLKNYSIQDIRKVACFASIVSASALAVSYILFTESLAYAFANDRGKWIRNTICGLALLRASEFPFRLGWEAGHAAVKLLSITEEEILKDDICCEPDSPEADISCDCDDETVEYSIDSQKTNDLSEDR